MGRTGARLNCVASSIYTHRIHRAAACSRRQTTHSTDALGVPTSVPPRYRGAVTLYRLLLFSGLRRKHGSLEKVTSCTRPAKRRETEAALHEGTAPIGGVEAGMGRTMNGWITEPVRKAKLIEIPA